ncbi:hypothetical protein Bbelb_209300 [Branchiostoma belcheri]|nr:hypothetical protein Bbelb_209300 [Branchiostoma belcheri]
MSSLKIDDETRRQAACQPAESTTVVTFDTCRNTISHGKTNGFNPAVCASVCVDVSGMVRSRLQHDFPSVLLIVVVEVYRDACDELADLLAGRQGALVCTRHLNLCRTRDPGFESRAPSDRRALSLAQALPAVHLPVYPVSAVLSVPLPCSGFLNAPSPSLHLTLRTVRVLTYADADPQDSLPLLLLVQTTITPGSALALSWRGPCRGRAVPAQQQPPYSLFCIHLIPPDTPRLAALFGDSRYTGSSRKTAAADAPVRHTGSAFCKSRRRRPTLRISSKKADHVLIERAVKMSNRAGMPGLIYDTSGDAYCSGERGSQILFSKLE